MKVSSRQISSVVLLALLTLLSQCYEVRDTTPQPNGPFTINGHLIQGTTKQPFNVGERIYLNISWMDFGFSSYSERLGAATIQSDGSFEITYPFHNESRNYGPIFTLNSNPFSSHLAHPNQNFSDTFYYANQGKLRLSIEAQDFHLGDTLFIAYPSVTSGGLIFDSLPLPYSDYLGEFDLPTGGIVGTEKYIHYRINNSLSQSYDVEKKRYSSTGFHLIKTIRLPLRGDPYIDTLNLVIKP